MVNKRYELIFCFFVKKKERKPARKPNNTQTHNPDKKKPEIEPENWKRQCGELK